MFIFQESNDTEADGFIAQSREVQSQVARGRNPTGFSDLPGGNPALAQVKASFCLGGQKTRLDSDWIQAPHASVFAS